jgi:hypothetical protein
LKPFQANCAKKANCASEATPVLDSVSKWLIFSKLLILVKQEKFNIKCLIKCTHMSK